VRTAIIGPDRGRTILTRVFTWLDPSSSADSYISMGIVFIKKALQRIMFHTAIAPGRSITHLVSSSPKSIINIYVGIMPPLNIMVKVKISIKTFLPIKVFFDNG
jgi:hypothetical protein